MYSQRKKLSSVNVYSEFDVLPSVLLSKLVLLMFGFGSFQNYAALYLGLMQFWMKIVLEIGLECSGSEFRFCS